MIMLQIKEYDRYVTLKIKLQPNSKKNAICGLYGNALKISLSSLPVNGKANKSCCEFLSELLKIHKKFVSIIKGKISRNKLVKIEGITKNQIMKIIKFYLNSIN